MNKFKNNIIIEDKGYSTPCWIWQGAKTCGYGCVTIAQKVYLIHRIMLWIKNNKEPNQTDHLCRIRSCINPEHLENVTYSINNQRMWDALPRRTHCKNGHEYTKENSIIGKDGNRRCRICKNIKNTVYNLLR